MPRRTKAESEATAASVLAAAVRLFGEHGYAAVRVDEVASAAGVTRGAVYHHFPDKQALFAASFDRVQQQVGDAVAAAADASTEAGEDAWTAFETGCRTFLRASVDDTARRIVLVDAPAVLGWAAWRDQDAAHSGHHLEEALAGLELAGLLTTPSRSATAALLSGAMNEAALWVARQRDSPTALDQAWSTLAVLLGALRASHTRS